MNGFQKLARFRAAIALLFGAVTSIGWAAPTDALEGTASWDIELVREYFKKTQGIDMPAEPARFDGQEQLAQLNPEFAARVRALMAVYQAHGGTPIGIMPQGGLRTREEQREIYAQCRDIRQVLEQQFGSAIFEQGYGDIIGQGVPSGDGSRREDWVQVCEKIATKAWMSWHNLGLAVDFGFANNDAYGRMIEAARDLGMIWGGWFGGMAPSGLEVFSVLPENMRIDGKMVRLTPYMRATAEALGWDLGHVEWHPGQDSVTPFEAQIGTALDTANLHVGYKWYLPDRIYSLTTEGASSPPSLAVYDLSAKDNWILLSKMRRIQGDAGQWHGTWYSFDPPIPLFPAYIPTIRFFRTSKDEFARRTTQVSVKKFAQSSTGGGAKNYQEWSGQWDYVSGFTLMNWEIAAELEIQRQDRMRKEEEARTKKTPPLYSGYFGFREFRKASVYNVEVYMDVQTSIDLILDRSVDQRGCTFDHKLHHVSGGDGIRLEIAWDRDRGKVGMPFLDLPPGGAALNATLNNRTVSSAPPGAFDRENPPVPPPANECRARTPPFSFGRP